MKRSCAVVLAILTMPLSARAQQVHRNSFEGTKPAWSKGPADAAFEETAHLITDQAAHEGQRCELIQLQTKTGETIYYLYAVGKAPIGPELSASLWLKGNRPGIHRPDGEASAPPGGAVRAIAAGRGWGCRGRIRHRGIVTA